MTVTVNDVQRIFKEHEDLGRTPAECVMGTRTSVFALLELESPPPTAEAVTDEHRIAADRARASDPHFTTAWHWLQKQHQTSLWQRADALCAEAGVK